jgi:hypothetical protein
MKGNEKLGQSPAFGQPTFIGPEGTIETAAAYFGEDGCGMSKRYYTALKMAQGMLSNPSFSNINMKPSDITKMAYGLADELLKQE